MSAVHIYTTSIKEKRVQVITCTLQKLLSVGPACCRKSGLAG